MILKTKNMFVSSTSTKNLPRRGHAYTLCDQPYKTLCRILRECLHAAGGPNNIVTADAWMDSSAWIDNVISNPSHKQAVLSTVELRASFLCRRLDVLQWCYYGS